MLLFELSILLLCIVVGARCGGIALGTVSGMGLLVFVVGVAYGRCVYARTQYQGCHIV